MSYLYDAYIADPQNNKVGIIHNDSFGDLIEAPGKPTAVCVDLNQMDVWVTNATGGIIKYKDGIELPESTSAGSYSNTVTRYRNGVPQDDIPVGIRPMGICSVPKNVVYVTNYGSNTVSKIYGNKVVKTIGVGSGPRGICSTRDGKLYVANYLDHTVSVIENDVVVATISVGHNPIGVCAGNSSFVYVSCSGSNTVSRILGFERLGDIKVGRIPYGICVDLYGIVYVANYGDDTVSKIVNNQVTDTILAGDGPYAISFNKDNEKYVSNYLGGTITKIVDDVPVDTISGMTAPCGFGDFIGGSAYNTHIYTPPTAGSKQIGIEDLDPALQALITDGRITLPLKDDEIVVTDTDTTVATLKDALNLMLKPESQMYFMVPDEDIYPGALETSMPIPYDGTIVKFGAFLDPGVVTPNDLVYAVEVFSSTNNQWTEIGRVTVAAGTIQEILELNAPVDVKAGDRVRLNFIDIIDDCGSLTASIYYRRTL